MASPAAYLVKIQRVSNGTHNSSANRIKKGVARNENNPVDDSIPMTTAQFQGLTNYLALMKNGDDTSTVETAITAL